MKKEREEVTHIKDELTRARSIVMKLYNEFLTGEYRLSDEEKYMVLKKVHSVEEMLKDLRIEAL